VNILDSSDLSATLGLDVNLVLDLKFVSVMKTSGRHIGLV